MVEIRRIGVVSAGKILGAIYAFLGLIIGALFTLVSFAGTLAGALAGSAGLGASGALFGVGAIVFLPVFYGLMGFVGGVITGVLYNIVAPRIGGLELETA